MKGLARTKQCGLTIVECAAALALAGLAVWSTARINQAAAALLRRTLLLAAAVDVARNLLEHELGAPCAAAFDCPAPYRCSITRSPAMAGTDHVVARVENADDGVAEDLHTLAPFVACGG